MAARCSRDKGMRYIVGKDWRDLFDVVIVQAEKPNFFNDRRRWVGASRREGRSQLPSVSVAAKAGVARGGGSWSPCWG